MADATIAELGAMAQEIIPKNRLKAAIAERVEKGTPSRFVRQLDAVARHLEDSKAVEVLSEKDLQALRDRVVEFEVTIDECLLEEGIAGLLGCRTIGRSISKLAKVEELSGAVDKLEDALISYALAGSKKCLCKAPEAAKLEVKPATPKPKKKV